MRSTLLSLAALVALAVSTNPADAQYRGRGVYRPSSSGVSSGGVSLSGISSGGVSLGSRSFDGNYVPTYPYQYGYGRGYGYLGTYYGGVYYPYYAAPSPGSGTGAANPPPAR